MSKGILKNYIKKVCKSCNIEFNSYSHSKNYCSDECKRQFLRIKDKLRYNQKKIIVYNSYICEKCDKEFVTTNLNQLKCEICKQTCKNINCFNLVKTKGRRCKICCKLVKSKHQRNKKHICKYCKKEYYNADIKGNQCYECKTGYETLCACGCGEKVIKKANTSGYKVGHLTKNKTYFEIYGTNDVKCGFKKGLENINFTSEKFQPYKLKWPDSKGKKFRSRLEAAFSNFCYNNNLIYEYEKRIKLIDGRIKIVDFIVNDIYIEISGYAHLNWQLDFDNKLKVLRETIQNPIIILTYNDKLSKIQIENKKIDIFFEDINNLQSIYKKIAMFTNMQIINEGLTLNEIPKFYKCLKINYEVKC